MQVSAIRLLLVFVATNTIMILMLVPSMTSQHPWLAYFLPGQFHAGGNYSGYWVFFALVLLVDAITVIAVGLIVLMPGLHGALAGDVETLKRRLNGSSGIAADLRDRLIEKAQTESAAARYQVFIGRSILIAGAAFLVLAFSSVTLSYTRAMPTESMFVAECLDMKAGCPGPREMVNSKIRLGDVQRFTLDQIAFATLVGAPPVYGWHIGQYTSNPDNLWFSNFVVGFRLSFALIVILILVSLRPLMTPKTDDDAVPAEGRATTG